MKKRLRSLTLWVLLVLLAVYNPLSARIMTVFTALHHSIDLHVFYNIVSAESSFNTLALSRKKAVGLGQVREPTAQYIYPNYFTGALWIPPLNLHIAATYYSYLLNKYSGNHSLSLAAYNWGETNVDRKIRNEGIVIEQEVNYREYFRNIPETYHYILSVLSD